MSAPDLPDGSSEPWSSEPWSSEPWSSEPRSSEPWSSDSWPSGARSDSSAEAWRLFDAPGMPVADPRLVRIFGTEAQSLATVEEYARAAAMAPDEVLEAISPLVAAGILGLDAVEGRFFVHTAPRGRPAPAGAPQGRPNLWELLRDRAPLARAYGLWRLLRDLEAAGWRTEVDQAVLELAAPISRDWLLCGVWVGAVCVPLLAFPEPRELSRILELFASVGTHGVACTVPFRGLDAAVTAVRSWILGRPTPAPITVFVLEAPAFGATLVRPDDNSVTPVVVQRYTAEEPLSLPPPNSSSPSAP